MDRKPSRRSFVLQGGLLAGAGLALVGGVEPRAEAAPICQMEGQCTFRKPLFLFVVDYSTAMNQQFMPGKTRWQAAVEAVTAVIDDQNGYLQGNAILGLMRFGHDPDIEAAWTVIPGDVSSPWLVDGQAIDVPFYDSQAPNKPYYQCNGEALKASLAGEKSPMDGAPAGIGAWTRGALLRAEGYVAKTIADHPLEMDPRQAALIVLTQGAWTDPSGTMVMQPAEEDPAGAAGKLFGEAGIPSYVVALGDANGKAAADALAAAGGTGQAYAGGDAVGLVMTLQVLVEQIKQDVKQPVCLPKLPRVMVLLDASSPMLNTMGGTVAGKIGETSWDVARAAIAGQMSIFDQVVNGNQKLENLVHFGVTVFGDAMPAPGEQDVLVDYQACPKDNIAWALDPSTSCAPPGCLDPWGGPPITWTFKDGSQVDPPGFDAKTLSHMPRCDAGGPFPLACSGSGAQLHLGLQLVQENLAAYKAKCQAPGFPYPCEAETKFINLLVTDGNDESDDAEVQAPLEQMYAAGVTTYVLGVGEANNSMRLQMLAGWGSGGQEGYFEVADQMALQTVLQGIVEAIPFDPCCSFNSCKPICGDGCMPDPFCGDGIVNGGEQCDDGNNTPGDGCEPDCTVMSVCGNGILEGAETCDDGNNIPGDGCEPNCMWWEDGCGNGVPGPGQECDDGNNIPGDGCEPDCSWTPVCGDGKLQKNEECDDGNKVPGDGCEPDCTWMWDTCGNGVLDLYEECDDGNAVSGDGCEPNCALTPSESSTGETTMAPTTGEVSSSTGESSTGEMVVGREDGCGCATEGDGSRGVFGVLFALAFGRRTRRRGVRA